MAITTVFFDLGDTLISSPGGVDQRDADALDVLQVLVERGYRIGLLSNQATGTTVAQVQTRLNNLRLARYIDPALVTISTEVAGNVGKPAQPIFNLALNKAGHAASSVQAIFVTEEASHIAAARGFGWRAILKRNTGTCVLGDGECVSSLAGLLGLLPPLADISGTQLDLAPPPKLVDGLWAVPIDISQINAQLRFDAATQAASGDATLMFKLGRNAGCPSFDLRQTPTAAWLDGASVPVGDIAAHDFGGGTQASLRVLARVLEAGSAHTLRVTYGVGLPQASTAGSYQPHIDWSAGPRLAFNFGFTDLGGGRYLEAFIPANLIHDQFALTLDLQLLNTAIAHTPITNCAVTALGANHWRIDFPASMTALSPMLELRAADTLASSTHNVVLPVSGSSVAVTAWALNSSGVNTATQAGTIAGFLVANETAAGRYAHGNRYTAFVNSGGMEYDGATTSSPGSLRHESFHSWWGRAMKPASQADGWIDEAWTVYNDNGASGSTPFNFADPAVELCSRNPWARSTPGAAYSAGERLWRGMAAIVGVSTLNALMRDYYAAHRSRPSTTAELEAFLLARSGRADIVDVFHRYAYGLADPAPQPDVWLRDEVGDPGADAWAGRFWDSPDLWVRQKDDGGLTHQNVEAGQDNWFHARVRNRSATATARHLVVSFNHRGYAGTQFSYPADFLPAVAATAAFDLAPGETRIVKARWPRADVPAAGTHPCLLAAVYSRFDQPVAGRHVWEQNNLAQKNLTVVDLLPNTWFVLPVQLRNLRPKLARSIELQVVRPADAPALPARLLTLKPALAIGDKQLAGNDATTLDCGCAGESNHDHAHAHTHTHADSRDADAAAQAFANATETPFEPGRVATQTLRLKPLESLPVGLRVSLPPGAKPGASYRLDLVQRENGKVVGGVALTIRAK
jgi:FMN phosphatase YigB (HAD superfamily)